MIILKKIMLMILLIFSLFTIISTVAAANYYVDSNTKHTDITNLMKKDAKKGDNLIFTGPKYDLTNTIVINKPINIKSENKTQINFKKYNKNMFKVTVSGVNFDGLSINHDVKLSADYEDDYANAVIYASGTTKKINIKNTNIKSSLPSCIIEVDKWCGNITNSKINAENAYAISSNNWVGNVVDSEIIVRDSSAITLEKWKGNIVNSIISSNSSISSTIHTQYWAGKIYRSKIYQYKGVEYEKGTIIYGVYIPNSKGTITNCTIKSSCGPALGISNNVKVSKCSLSSAKGYTNIDRLQSDLEINSVKKSGKIYKIDLYNQGPSDSKPCYLVITCGNTILKKVSVKSLAVMDGPFFKTIKVAIPTKYANNKYTKTATIDYYKKNKENNRKNNQYKFKF